MIKLHVIIIYLLSPDTLMKVYKTANELKFYGEKYAWFAGTKVRYFLKLKKLEKLRKLFHLLY